jgi:hypothetical protein
MAAFQNWENNKTETSLCLTGVQKFNCINDSEQSYSVLTLVQLRNDSIEE